MLAVRDLVPVLSWVSTLGRCRHCQAPVSGRYPLTDGRESVVLDASSAAVRAAQARDAAARRRRLARLAALPGVRVLAVRAGEELFAALDRGFAA